MMRKITLPYGHQERTIEIPEANLAWIEGPRHAEPIPDIEAAVRQAIRNPIGSPTLAELVQRHGWSEMARRIPIRCFQFNPSVKSSLTFLRKTPWARAKVESWFIRELADRLPPNES